MMHDLLCDAHKPDSVEDCHFDEDLDWTGSYKKKWLEKAQRAMRNLGISSAQQMYDHVYKAKEIIAKIEVLDVKEKIIIRQYMATWYNDTESLVTKCNESD